VVPDRDRTLFQDGPGAIPGLLFSDVRFARFSIEGLIMNLLTKLAIIGLGVMVLMLLGVAVLMLWRS
jgi:hypothetical protein